MLRRLLQAINDWRNGSLPDKISQRVAIDEHHIYLTYIDVDPIDIALYADLGWRNTHTTRNIVVDVFGDYYEGELPRIARRLVWEYNNGRTIKPTTFTLDLTRIRNAEKIQHCREIFRGYRAGQYTNGNPQEGL